MSFHTSYFILHPSSFILHNIMMRFWSKLSLFLIFSILPSFSAPSSTSIFCPLVAWSAQQKDSFLLASSQDRDFGDDGRNGTDGRSGRSGRDGENRTIFANGTPVNLELSGESGEDGENGKYGEDADCERQPLNVTRDLRAADGGEGGDGGSGGNGGNGGSVTVYYTNPADLKQIFVRFLLFTSDSADTPLCVSYGAPRVIT
ncbi:hypothetical protein NJ959_19910, partial [Symplocastrum sp. BBK-W-15]|nr:hypothetical protein [Limnofasciculus baicalensis BBK-W-15]